MITLQEIEEKHNFTFPTYFKRIWDQGILNEIKGFEEGFEFLTPEEILNFEAPFFWDIETHHFIPFAKTVERNYFAFYNNVKIEDETPIVEIWDEMDDTEYYAKNFEDFIFRQMVESAEEIDTDDINTYISDLLQTIKSLTPYLKPSYIKILEEIYTNEPQKIGSDYSLLDSEDSEKIVKENIDFKQLGESFSHEN